VNFIDLPADFMCVSSIQNRQQQLGCLFLAHITQQKLGLFSGVDMKLINTIPPPHFLV
jgi:hypothetical protein